MDLLQTDYICTSHTGIRSVPTLTAIFREPVIRMSLYEQINAYCISHKVRLAEKRVIVADQLLSAKAFTDGDTLWRDMRSQGIKISPATVYESLNWLVMAGFAERRFAVDSRKNLFGIREPVRNALGG